MGNYQLHLGRIELVNKYSKLCLNFEQFCVKATHVNEEYNGFGNHGFCIFIFIHVSIIQFRGVEQILI